MLQCFSPQQCQWIIQKITTLLTPLTKISQMDYLSDYKAYYAARAERYANNPNYENTYRAELALSNAMQSCNELEEFRHKVGDLPDKCAFALLQDEYQMEQSFYEEQAEPYRKMTSDYFLERLSGCNNVQDAITLAQEANHHGSSQIVSDEYHREFIGKWSQLDEIEIYTNARIPDQYRADFDDYVSEMKQKMAQDSVATEVDFRKFIPEWTEQPERCMEIRHKRFLPYKDEHIQEKLTQYKTIINR